MRNDEERVAVSVAYTDEQPHGGPGWYWWESDIPEEGSYGPFATEAAAVKSVNECIDSPVGPIFIGSREMRNQDRKRPVTWEAPPHTPIERSHERLDGGFVKIGGWQIKYDPTPEHRRKVHGIVEAEKVVGKAKKK